MLEWLRSRAPSRDLPKTLAEVGMPIKFEDSTPEQAEEFRAHVVAREPYRLRDLAERMAATGGPVEAMDASVDSLVPLWEWFVGYLLAGLPGVPEDALPSRATPVDDPTPDDRWRRRVAVACEGLEHYVRVVLERAYAQAPWVVLEDVRDFRHHETLVQLPVGHFLSRTVFGLALHAQTDRFSARSARKLRDHVLSECGDVPDLGHRPSVLAPYLATDLPPMPAIASVSPRLRWETEASGRAASGVAAPTRSPRGGEELVFVAGTGDDLNDRPHKVRPLPVAVVAAALTAAGFTSDDADHVVPEHLLQDDIHLMHRDEVAVVGTFVHDGHLRALFFEPYGGTQAQWDAMEIQLRHLAETLDARLAPEDQLD